MDRAVGANFGGADGDQTVQKRVPRCGRFETRDGAEIAMRVVSDACERHVNQTAVVGLECDPQVERRSPSNEPPVTGKIVSEPSGVDPIS